MMLKLSLFSPKSKGLRFNEKQTPFTAMNSKIKTQLIVLLSFTFPSLGYNQVNSSIDLVAGFESSFRNLSTSNEEQAIQDILTRRNDTEEANTNWRFGFNYNKRLKNKVFLKTGLRLARVGYNEIVDGLIWGTEHDGMGGFNNVDSSFDRTVQVSRGFFFLEVPVVARLELSRKKFSPFIEMGFSPSLYLTTRVKSITETAIITDFSNQSGEFFNELHFVGSIAIGANYSISDKIQIFGQPTFRYHITSLSKDRPIKEYLFNYGVEVGIRRILN
ncbi:MAG: hypothetical protein AAFO07_24320 [Bacteroidota bacterium]